MPGLRSGAPRVRRLMACSCWGALAVALHLGRSIRSQRRGALPVRCLMACSCWGAPAVALCLGRSIRSQRRGARSGMPVFQMASTPSPVRNITNSMSMQTLNPKPSRTIWFETPPSEKPAESLANADELSATVGNQMAALGELEFNKIFLIYVYIAGNKIEDVHELHEEYIRSLQPLPMDDFESEIWHKFGHKFIPKYERRENLDWDPMKTKEYHCYIDKMDDSIVTIFKGPYSENGKTHLQNVVGDDNILVVKFPEMPGHTNVDEYFRTYRQVAEEGIILGSRRYRFLIYKDGGKEKRKQKKGKNEENHKYSCSVKCYFIRTGSGWDRDEPYIFSNKEIDEIRNSFMHILTVPTVAKYVARFSLILSKTTTLLDADDLSNVKVTIIEDVPCQDENGNIVLDHGETSIHTDGTGLISEDLAMKCPASVFRGNVLSTHDLQPLLMQICMFYDGLAVKGTLLVDRRIPSGSIHIRPSMIKATSDPSLPRGQCFNSLEIVTTSNRPKRAFTSRFLITLLHYGGVPENYFLELAEKALQDVEKACDKASDALEVAYNHADMDDEMSARMILSGIRPEDDAYLKHQLAAMVREEREGIKLGRIPICESYHLMGTIDPTGTLKPNEVCIIHENGQVSGEVLIYRYPGLHFGDVHVLTATPIRNLEKTVVGSSKYGILFPISGSRPLADEMAGGDYDGDMFFVSRNPQIDIPGELRVKKHPHYMEGKTNTYHSTSVLGKIYDKAISWQAETIPTISKLLFLVCLCWFLLCTWNGKHVLPPALPFLK
uniref:Uncharacterized protein n=1 Tax=Avena sativa TaxID=4498 RepID=A0ACD5VTA2_AVESA